MMAYIKEERRRARVNGEGDSSFPRSPPLILLVLSMFNPMSRVYDLRAYRRRSIPDPTLAPVRENVVRINGMGSGEHIELSY